MSHTTTDLATEIGRSRQHINRIARQLFGPGGWRRDLTPEQYQRLKAAATEQPGRHRKNMFPNVTTVQRVGENI